jgi:hypothetical protein
MPWSHNEIDYLYADLATVEALLASAPSGDVLGRMSLESRRDVIRAELAQLGCLEKPR